MRITGADGSTRKVDISEAEEKSGTDPSLSLQPGDRIFVPEGLPATINALGSVTGRGGAALGPSGRTLLFGKGGFAWSLTDDTITRNAVGGAFPFTFLDPFVSNRASDGRIGWTNLFVVHSGYDHSPEAQERKKQRDLHLLHLELQDEPDHPFTLFNLGMNYADTGDQEKPAE